MVSFIGGGNRSTSGENHQPAVSHWHFITYCFIEYSTPWTEFELTTLVVIDTNCIDSCKSNYNTITMTMASCVGLVQSRLHHHNRKVTCSLVHPGSPREIFQGETRLNQGSETSLKIEDLRSNKPLVNFHKFYMIIFLKKLKIIENTPTPKNPQLISH